MSARTIWKRVHYSDSIREHWTLTERGDVANVYELTQEIEYRTLDRIDRSSIILHASQWERMAVAILAATSRDVTGP